jgi:hypothetical protein
LRSKPPESSVSHGYSKLWGDNADHIDSSGEASTLSISCLLSYITSR